MELFSDSFEKLRADGTVIPSNNEYIIYIGATPENPNQFLQYFTDDGIIHTIVYERCWTDVFFIEDPTWPAWNAAMTLLLGQKGTGIGELSELEKLWKSQDYTADGSFQYRNMTFTWQTDLENCIALIGNSISRDNEDLPATAQIYFEIRINSIRPS